MIKKKEVKKVTKMNKWLKLGLWIVGVLVGLIVVIILGLKIWVLTWPEYKGDGFSFRYPKGWYIEHYVYRNDVLDTVQFSPQPQFYDRIEGGGNAHVVDHSKVPISMQLDVYDKNDENLESFKKMQALSLKLGWGHFLYIGTSYARFLDKSYPTVSLSLLVITNDKIYNFDGDFNVLTGDTPQKRPDLLIESILSGLSLRY